MYINSVYMSKFGNRITVYGVVDKSEEFLFTYAPGRISSFNTREFIGLTIEECIELADNKKNIALAGNDNESR